MRRRGGAGLGLTLLLWGGAAWGATYYSAPSGSGTACSLEAPCSLGTGTSTLRPGDTLYLRGGTYNDGINPTTGALASGGGESSRTTIAAYPGETPELTRITLGEGGGFAWMTFRQLRVAGEVFLGPDTHHIRLEQSDIVNPPSMGISGGGGYHEFLGNTVHGAYWYGTYWAGHDSLFDGNSFYDNGGYGVHLYSATTNTVDNNVIRNNQIYNNGLRANGPGSGGVVVSHGRNNIVDNNVISDNFSGVAVDYECDGCQVTNNTITNNQAYGISVGSRATNTVLRNNLLSGNGSGDAVLDTGSGTVASNNAPGTGASVEPSRTPVPSTPPPPPKPTLPPRTTSTIQANAASP